MLGVGVGVPTKVLTVTVSLNWTVKATSVPGPSSPLGAVIVETVGAVVSICRMPVGLTLLAPDSIALLPVASFHASALKIRAVLVAVLRSAESWLLPVAPTV